MIQAALLHWISACSCAAKKTKRPRSVVAPSSGQPLAKLVVQITHKLYKKISQETRKAYVCTEQSYSKIAQIFSRNCTGDTTLQVILYSSLHWCSQGGAVAQRTGQRQKSTAGSVVHTTELDCSKSVVSQHLHFGQKITFFFLQEAFCGLEYAENAFATGASPRTPLRKLTTLPQTS